MNLNFTPRITTTCIKALTSLISCAALSAPLAALAQAPIVIKFSHVAAVDTPKGQAAEYFKKIVEERTKGKVKVEVFANSTLFKDKEELEALQIGSVQMLAPVPGKFGPLGVKEFEVFDLPYIFKDIEAVHRFSRGPGGASLLKKLDSRGVTGLAYWDNGFRVMSANKPIHTPADMKGLKMRINSSKVNASIMKSVGAQPQSLAFSEVYQALQTGVVDGTEGPLSNLYTQKQYEVQKHITLSYHTISNYVVVANKKFWDGLPADIRSTLETAIKDATTYNDSVAEKDEASALAAIKASGKSTVYAPTAAEMDAWAKAMQSVHAEMADRVGGKAFIDSVSAASAK
ncbi:C4-dicarboxylate-binding periplasmic protein DctP [Rhodoferax lithotrophicus]|uniref:C4-dicarboxylate-binding periplasmic protein DctP n=1 Tax=Rhodoferax lithotrophicus TaxID=2798804 RepID=A0ABN6D389_9BURK|nr:DctP family TRAP transporter solute-binding subunit [Rhodoferax sp. MIZ03]BCO26474.1 C4-dicarboxylate-binding periplasmic protein DctP [Rhodoferax sp. MIZ03]